MQKGLGVNRSDLAVAKEPAYGHIRHLASEHLTIVICATIEVHTAPEAREEQRALGLRTLYFATVSGQHLVEVFRRSRGVSNVELHHLLLLNERANADHAGHRVEPDEVPDQKVPFLGIGDHR